MEKLQQIPVPMSVAKLVHSRQPARVAVFVQRKSSLYTSSPDQIVKIACTALDIPVDDSRPTLLVVEKWDRLDVLVFDIFHVEYDFSTAHLETDLPVILVDYGKRYSVIKDARAGFRKEATVA
ncbi:uncharacterized protein B0T15DRAFT_262937 [Chaetomium strumarium]|uniref:Uncharacterized protein n=1 Tax=Chaetomium strumarium TaxID=1170767 RepID=A0AAJ0GNB1_9PEZI|nr:hypothetical protein B0T15DRAFT_262937 [Chaetomium strumarium]